MWALGYKTTFSINAYFLIWSYEACNNDKLVIENLVLGPKVYWAEEFPGQSRQWAKAGIGQKYYIIRAKVFLGPKYAWDQSECGAKVVLGPNWV